MAALLEFTRLPLTHRYETLRESLWPIPGHANRLSQYIETCDVDLSMWNAESAMDVDQLIRYIDLTAHPIFGFHNLTRLPVLIVRQEYDDFITEINDGGSAAERCFFLTGQPGIGK